MRLGLLRISFFVLALGLVGAGPALGEVLDLQSLPAGFYDSDPAPGNLFLISGTEGTEVDVFGANPGPAGNHAVVFDTSNPTGGDDDLGTPNMTCPESGGPGVGDGGAFGSPFENCEPLGNILIIGADLIDADMDGLVDDPDDINTDASDFAGITLQFSQQGPVTANAVTIIDIDGNGPDPRVELADINDDLIAVYPIPQTGNNGVAVIDLEDTPNVFTMRVKLQGSGGLVNVEWNRADDPCEIEVMKECFVGDPKDAPEPGEGVSECEVKADGDGDKDKDVDDPYTDKDKDKDTDDWAADDRGDKTWRGDLARLLERRHKGSDGGGDNGKDKDKDKDGDKDKDADGGNEVLYTYKITNVGDTDVFDVTAEDDILGTLPGTPIDEIPAGEMEVIRLVSEVTEDTTNVVTVEAETASGQVCRAEAEATVTVKPDDGDKDKDDDKDKDGDKDKDKDKDRDDKKKKKKKKDKKKKKKDSDKDDHGDDD